MIKDLTLRDLFAAFAMNAMIQTKTDYDGNENIAVIAYGMADAMLAEKTECETADNILTEKTRREAAQQNQQAAQSTLGDEL
jgi:hypothetical protein